MKRKRNLGILTALIIVLGGLIAYDRLGSVSVKTAPAKNQQIAGVQTDKGLATEFSYFGQEGRSALELLKDRYRVETKEYGFGEMVQSINGVAADKDHFWAFYINGEMAQVGAGEYSTSNGELIEWKLEEIK